ncbi:MAG: U32 family peptidase [Candidatus Omnitrophota bacterium]|jgi:putative protease|nr:MAG: U32 family peptidase [Candidatus Omnitrophota bacterium]
MNQIELLAPAKNLECGLTAVKCGADAVYIGAPSFGAREQAGNSLDDIAALVRYAHPYWVRIYATVNTILFDHEISLARDLIWKLYEIGIDGVIIQDMGLLECDLPPLPLIASTQMHNHSPEKIAFLEQAGFQRAILARELTLDQIKAIHKAALAIELEFFIHGSLCVSYSGQCYMSYAMGGRSGNRGQCAQPCRKIYSLIDKQGRVIVDKRYLLSLRDINLSEHLDELIQAGITSFKIEGRLKDPAYVANVVAFYRNRLDGILEQKGLHRSSSGKSTLDFTPDLEKTFNRGYTTYFLLGKNHHIGSIDTPKMVGEPIGRITHVSKTDIRIDTAVSLHPGDGICFFNRRGRLCGSNINAVSGKAICPDKRNGLEKGLMIYRNHDHEFLTRIQNTRTDRKIHISITISDHADGLVFIVEDEDGNHAEYVYSDEFQIAENPEPAIATLRKQLAKTGNTEFQADSIHMETTHTPFLPIAMLNDLRRSLLARLSAIRLQNRPIVTGIVLKNDVPYPRKELLYFGNVLNRHAERFYRRHGVTSIQPAAESGIDLHGQKVMTTRYCIQSQLNRCPKQSHVQRYEEPLYLIDEEGHRFELRFNCEACEMEIVYK